MSNKYLMNAAACCDRVLQRYNVTRAARSGVVELWSAASQGINVKSGNLVARLSFIWSRQTAAFVRE